MSSDRPFAIVDSIPAPARGQFLARVVGNPPICREHYRLVVSIDGTFPATRPGQFVQIACADLGLDDTANVEIEWIEGQPPHPRGSELLAPRAFLRRPFSLAGRRDLDGRVELEFIQRIVGRGTGWLGELKVGDEVNLLGPLGNAFKLPPRDEPAILVGGGVGIPPMIYLASTLGHRRAVAFCGALARDLLPLTITDAAPSPTAEGIDPLYNIAEFAAHGVATVITTDDGSYGFRGFVTQALEKYLDRYFAGTSARPVIYTCGPEPMMKRVGQIAMARGLECQIAVERAMACGMGTCQSCVIRVKASASSPHAGGNGVATTAWTYKLACTDGPVFRADELLW